MRPNSLPVRGRCPPVSATAGMEIAQFFAGNEIVG